MFKPNLSHTTLRRNRESIPRLLPVFAPVRLLVLVFAIVSFALVLPAGSFAQGTASSTIIENGFDSGTLNIADTWGDVVMSYLNQNNETSYAIPDSPTTTSVDTGYDMNTLTAYDTQNAIQGSTVTLSYSFLNLANTSGTIALQVIVVEGILYETHFYRDENNNGTLEASEQTEVTGMTLAEDAGESLILAVLIPDTANDLDTMIIEVYAWNVVGDSVQGFGDSWPTQGDTRDFQVDTVPVVVKGPLMRLAKSVTLDGGKARPFDTMTYSITYDNDGSDSAFSVVLVDVLPQYTEWVVGSVDTSAIHSGTVSISYSNGFSGAFSDPESTNVRRVRFAFNTNISPTDGDDKSTPQTGGTDAGVIRFKVRVQ